MRVEIEIFHECGVCVRQGSALSLVLFIMVVNLISRSVSEQEVSRKILHADNMTLVSDTKEERQKRLHGRNDSFIKHGLRMNLVKERLLWTVMEGLSI